MEVAAGELGLDLGQIDRAHDDQGMGRVVGEGLRADDLIRAIREEFKEHEDLPNTTNPDDWAKIAGKKGEKIVHIRTIIGGGSEARQIETITTGHYL